MSNAIGSDLWPWTETERREAERRERSIERAMLRCVHNTKGTVRYHEPENQHMHVCAAGVDWTTVAIRNKEGFPPTQIQRRFGFTIPSCESIPCSELLNAGGAVCPKRRLFTREEAIARLAAEAQEAENRHR